MHYQGNTDQELILKIHDDPLDVSFRIKIDKKREHGQNLRVSKRDFPKRWGGFVAQLPAKKDVTQSPSQTETLSCGIFSFAFTWVRLTASNASIRYILRAILESGSVTYFRAWRTKSGGGMQRNTWHHFRFIVSLWNKLLVDGCRIAIVGWWAWKLDKISQLHNPPN